MRICFLDIEASGLDLGTYPVEIAWRFEDGGERSIMIAPPEVWGVECWDPVAETVHGLSRDLLEAEGMPATEAADLVIEELAGCHVLTDAPLADGTWLEMLLDLASAHREIVLHDFEMELFQRMARTVEAAQGTSRLDASTVIALRKAYLRACQEAERSHPRTHRALADARHLSEVWRLSLIDGVNNILASATNKV